MNPSLRRHRSASLGKYERLNLPPKITQTPNQVSSEILKRILQLKGNGQMETTKAVQKTAGGGTRKGNGGDGAEAGGWCPVVQPGGGRHLAWRRAAREHERCGKVHSCGLVHRCPAEGRAAGVRATVPASASSTCLTPPGTFHLFRVSFLPSATRGSRGKGFHLTPQF